MPAPHTLRVIPVLLAALPLSGCANWVAATFAPQGAAIDVASIGADPARMQAVLPYASYEVRLWEESFCASDVPLEALLAGGVRDGQFLHVQLLWFPKAGRTPVHADALNVVLRYIVVSDGKVGLYGGGGFAWPRGTPGTQPMTLVVRSSTLALLARSEGFVDPLTPASIEGTLVAPPDEETTRRYRRGMSQIVTDAVGRSRWVDAEGAPLSTDQVLALLRAGEGVSDAISVSAATIDGATGSRRGS
jgi:hypothetical protein